MESEQSERLGGGGEEESSGSDTLSESETLERRLLFEQIQCRSSRFVCLKRAKNSKTGERSDEIKVVREEGENEEDEMIFLNVNE
ncbi:hypothetical protein DNTS_025270 [Danionella cerebrum]|uniref:Uncharacterized protein n=1 Tax=Danionella cerebrum TaxID=2873325 RepID=A0A553PII6_9TELE|nr:hypothetical protein DNTS_025270 [Danionella translucida]